jgi:hypothetical protein
MAGVPLSFIPDVSSSTHQQEIHAIRNYHQRKGFIMNQSAVTNKDSLDFKSQTWMSDGRTIVLVLSDGLISQVDSSPVHVDINFNNPTGATVTPLTARQKGFVRVTGSTRLHFVEPSQTTSFAQKRTP